MSYGLNEKGGTGLLSLLKNFGNKNMGSQTTPKKDELEHHIAKTPTRAANTGAVSDNEIDYLERRAMSINELQEKFSVILGSLALPDQAQVIKQWSLSDDDGKTNLMNMIVANPDFATGYAMQNETPAVTNLGL